MQDLPSLNGTTVYFIRRNRIYCATIARHVHGDPVILVRLPDDDEIVEIWTAAAYTDHAGAVAALRKKAQQMLDHAADVERDPANAC